MRPPLWVLFGREPFNGLAADGGGQAPALQTDILRRHAAATGVSVRRGIKGTSWQTSFGDHFLRGDERLEQVVEYVLNNPVQSEFVERWGDYRCSGWSVFGLVDAGGGQAPALQRKLDQHLCPPSGRGRGEGAG